MKNLKLILAICLLGHFSFSQKNKKKIVSNNIAIESIQATNGNDRMAAFEQRKKLDDASLVKNVKFRSVGPTVMSGRVSDIDVNDAKPSEFYVSYATGGLWKTENNGQSFKPLFDNEAVMTLGDIAVDWKTKGQTIWVGTGESISSRSSYSGIGVYKSEDGGKSWQHKGLNETHHIGEIKLHPTDGNTVWVAALGHLYTPNKERGIFKTNDGGKTWKHTLYVDENTGAIDLQIDPINPNILYAVSWYKTRRPWNFVEGGKSSNIYKSTDGGDSWKLISSPESGFPQGEGNGRIGLAIAPSNPNIVYAVLDNQARRPEDPKEIAKNADKLTSKKFKELTKESFLKLDSLQLAEYLESQRFPEKYTVKSLKDDIKADKIKVTDIYKYTQNANDDLFDTPIVGAEIYRSENGGITWKKANAEYLDYVFNTYGYVFSTVHVSPTNADKIVIPGYQVIKSEDGGKTFSSINAPNVHADHHVLWMNPKDDNHMILGNDGGLNISYDNGKTWFFANTPALGQFYSVNVDMAKPYNVYGGLQDNGVWTGPSTYKHSMDWYSEGHYPYKSIMGGDGMQVEIDKRDNNTVYSGFQFGNYFRINKATGETKYLTIPHEVGEPNLRWNWQSPIQISKHNQDIIYYGSNKFHRSFDKGDTWKTISDDLTKGGKEGDVPFGTLTTIDESTLKFGLIYAGTDDGLIHVSTDGGYNWTKISDNLPQNLWVSRVTASSHQEGTVYVSLNGYREDHFNAYIYQSTDYGKTWKKLGENLPAEPVNVIKEDPKNANLLYVGTDHGVYLSLNKGKDFMQMSGDLPATPVHDLVIHPRDNELVLGTHGRSIYIADVNLVQQLTDSLLAKEIHVFDLNKITVKKSWGQNQYNYEKPEKLEYILPFYAKNFGKTKIQIKTDKGLILKELIDESEAGLNFATWDYTIDKRIVGEYEKYLNDTKSKQTKTIKIEEADDKQIYILAGKYKLVFETSNNEKIEKDLEVKNPEKRIRRFSPPSPINSPDSFEEWYEEEGFEEKK
jgi:photosystem II stability/assembly factor-like uncharacterized protein